MIGRALTATILVFGIGMAGCSLTDVGRPLSVDITADPEAASVGDTITFVVAGTGSFMSGFRIDYDDGSDPEERGTGGSQTATTTFAHAYGAAGTYSAVATIIDSSGELSDTVAVVIEEEN